MKVQLPQEWFRLLMVTMMAYGMFQLLKYEVERLSVCTQRHSIEKTLLHFADCALPFLSGTVFVTPKQKISHFSSGPHKCSQNDLA
jgi:hypothetical protein